MAKYLPAENLQSKNIISAYLHKKFDVVGKLLFASFTKTSNRIFKSANNNRRSPKRMHFFSHLKFLLFHLIGKKIHKDNFRNYLSIFESGFTQLHLF